MSRGLFSGDFVFSCLEIKKFPNNRFLLGSLYVMERFVFKQILRILKACIINFRFHKKFLRNLFGGTVMNEKEKLPQVDLALVLGYIATKDLTTTEKKVAVLTQLGFSNKDMAKICDTTDKVISTLKSKVKKGA